MPTPQEDESQSEFIERCIPIVLEDGTAEDDKQAYAICLSMWQEAKDERGTEMNYIRAFCERAEGLEDNDPVRWIGSTEGIKRDGKELKADDWDLTNYNKYSPVLFGHDYFGQRLPIGTAVANIEDKRLILDVTYDSDDEFAMAVRRKALKGMIAGSVGWNDIPEGKGKVRHELLEFSMVPIPADPESLPVRQMQAIRNITQWAKEIIRDEELANNEQPILDLSKVDIWEGVSAAMVGLFSQGSAIEDETRHGLYIALERAYRKLGKVPPEFRTHDELTALSDTELRGLFLNDELVRAGAVLSARNRNNLEQAQALIQQVLDSAQKEEAQTETDRSVMDFEQLKALHDILYRSDQNE